MNIVTTKLTTENYLFELASNLKLLNKTYVTLCRNTGLSGNDNIVMGTSIRQGIEYDLTYTICIVEIDMFDTIVIPANGFIDFEGIIYQNRSGASITPSPSTEPIDGVNDPYWSKATMVDLINLAIDSPTYELVVPGNTLVAPSKILLTLKECGVWRLKNEHAFNQTVSLYDILGELVEDYTIEAADEYLDMEIGVDGTYYIEVFKEGESFGDNPSTDFSIPIFSYCGVRKCLKALISDIICVDECSEPCDGKTSVKRATISRITALMYLLDRYIFVERDKFYNTMLIDTERREFMGMISKIGIALKSIVNRCGECGDTTTTSSGCNGCQ